jgi:hypothetical protein
VCAGVSAAYSWTLDQQVESIVADLTDERFLDQRLQHVERPGRIVDDRQVDDRLDRLEGEAALEYRQLRERGFLGLRKKVPGPVEGRPQRGLAVGASPVVDSSLKRSLMRASSVRGGITRTRAAANSIASGRPSSRATSGSIAAASAPCGSKSRFAD